MHAIAKCLFAGLFILSGIMKVLASGGKGENKGLLMETLKNSGIYSTDLPSDSLIPSLLEKNLLFFDRVLNKRHDLKIQIIYTSIDRDKKNKIKFTDHYFQVDSGNYFYPASTVKLPVAILALQKLNELKISGLDRNSTMITEPVNEWLTGVNNDPSAADGRPTIAHYIKKILLVSDNDAFNRLYEFLGQEYINNSLHNMGYSSAQIIHRLEISPGEEQNRLTNPVSFFDSTGKLIYQKPVEKSQLVYARRSTKIGNGFYRGGQLVNEPFDFSKKNRLSLLDLHHIVRSVLFPESVPEKQRFNLTKEDYDFLRRYMSMMPQESVSPVYASPDYWDTYVKFLFYGAEKGKAEPGIRIFNKVGDAYGFMIDAAYVADFKNKIEFLLSAVIYCNSDGILNDDKYEYKTVGLPFLKNLGRIFYEYELKRERKRRPDLAAFQFQYSH